MENLDFFQGIPEDVTCTHKVGYAGVTSNYHRHDNYEIYLLLNGSVNFFLEQNGFHMTRGSGLFIRPDTFHRLEYLDPEIYERINIHIKSSYFKTLHSAHTDLDRILNPKTNKTGLPYLSFRLTEDQISLFMQRAAALENALLFTQYGDDILSECILRELLVFLNRFPMTSQKPQAPNVFIPAIVTEMFAYIHENLTGDLSVDALAEIFHHNGHYLSRRFRESMGISLQQYIIYKRLDLARKHLSAGYPLVKVCYFSGFHDYSNFAKTFSKYVGVSPKQYQMQTMSRS